MWPVVQECLQLQLLRARAQAEMGLFAEAATHAKQLAGTQATSLGCLLLNVVGSASALVCIGSRSHSALHSSRHRVSGFVPGEC